MARASPGSWCEVPLMTTTNQHDPRNDPGFDPDSPDVADPQIDPIGPAKAPDDGQDVGSEKRVDDDQYPPYDDDK